MASSAIHWVMDASIWASNASQEESAIVVRLKADLLPFFEIKLEPVARFNFFREAFGTLRIPFMREACKNGANQLV